MTARLIDGRAAAAALRERIATQVAAFRAATGRAPGLATVLVGEDPASAVYVRSKGKATLEAGMESFSHTLSRRHLASRVARPRRRASTPTRRSTESSSNCRCRRTSTPTRSSSRSTPTRTSTAFTRSMPAASPSACPVSSPARRSGCLMLLKDTLGELAGLHAVVVGRSNIVGKPMAQLAAQGKLHRDHRPFAHPRPAVADPPGRHPRRRHRPARR